MQLPITHASTLAAFLKRWQTAILVAITLLAAFLRFYRLPEMPPGLFSDEAWAAYLARGVLQTGQLEVFFASNQGAEPLLIYLGVPVVALLGSPIWQLRIPEAIVGTLTIPAIWWMCRELFGRRSARADNPPTDDEFVFGSLLGLGSALALAVLFWHINLSRIAMEPILVPLFMCLAFAALGRALETGRLRDYALAGVVLAGNLYTYKAGYAVPLLAAAFVAYVAAFEKGFVKREWRGLLAWVGAAVVAYAPMILYAAAHPTEFFLRFGSVTVESRFTPAIDVGANLVKVLGMFFVEGDSSQRYNIPGRPALDPLMALLFVAGLARALISLRSPRLGLLALWLVVMSLPTLLSEFAPHWGRAIGVTPVLAALSALGGVSLWQAGASAGRKWLSAVSAGAVGLIVAVSGAVAVRDYFGTFSQQSYLFYSFDDGAVRLSEYANTIPASQRVYVVTDLPGSYTLQYVIRRPYVTYNGRNGVVFPPPRQEATTLAILQRGSEALRAIRDARPDARAIWSLEDRDGRPYARAFRFPPVDAPAPPPPNRLDALLGGSIRLVGYELDKTQVKPGGAVTLTLYWQAIKPVSQDYTVFVHLQKADTDVIGADSPPLAASYPTSVWLPGETILDEHVIAIPRDAPAGEYRLRVGLYLLETLQRLPAVDAGGVEIPEDAIEVGTVRVAPAG